MQQFKYEIIAEKINILIDSGVYPKGSKLPAHRELAKQLQTTAVTVAKAYKLLVERRKIRSDVGRGSYVLTERLENVISSTADDILNFSILQPCLSVERNNFQRQLSERNHLIESNTIFHQYNENSGLLKHRQAGAKWCAHYGLDIIDCHNGEGIILTNGAQNALATIIQLYTKEGDAIAVEAQAYPGVLSICKYLRRRVVSIAMDNQGMLPEALVEQCKIDKPKLVIIVPSEQNPTTATMLNERRKNIAEVIRQEVLWLIEDDLYAFLNEGNLIPITNLIPERSFYISSLSKAISPGLRCGFLKTPKDEWSKVVDYIRATMWLVSPFMFELASDIIFSNDAFLWAKRQKQKAAERQILISKYLSSFVLNRQASSYACWLSLPGERDSTMLTKELKLAGVLVSDATYFNASGKNNAIRLSVMSVIEDVDFVRGLKIIDNII